MEKNQIAVSQKISVLESPERKEKLRQILQPLSVYQWFDSRNMNSALQSFEASAHAAVNGIDSQMSLHAKDTLFYYNKDRAEKSVNLGKKLSLDVKLFAVCEPKNNSDSFKIKSDKWDWEILPLNISDERVPARFLKRVTHLSQNNIFFDSWAVAVPSSPNCMPVAHAIKGEALNVLKDIAKISAGAKNAAYKGVKAVAPAVRLSRKAIDAFLKDPVLLGCYGNDPVFLVEVGRWV